MSGDDLGHANIMTEVNLHVKPSIEDTKSLASTLYAIMYNMRLSFPSLDVFSKLL